jgi:hypothetical protein
MTDSKVIEAISRIVAYNWTDEESDYNHEALEEGNSREGHILGDLMLVQRWLEVGHGYPHVEPRIEPDPEDEVPETCPVGHKRPCAGCTWCEQNISPDEWRRRWQAPSQG